MTFYIIIVVAIIFGIAIGSISTIFIYNSIVFKNKNKKVKFEDEESLVTDIPKKSTEVKQQGGSKTTAIYNKLVPKLNHFGLDAFNSGNFNNHKLYN